MMVPLHHHIKKFHVLLAKFQEQFSNPWSLCPYLQFLPEWVDLFLHLVHDCRSLTGLDQDFLLQALQSESHTFRDIKTFIFTFRLCCTQCKIIGFLVKRIMNPNIMFLLFPTSPTFFPWTRGQIRVHRQVPHLRVKVKMETVNVFLHKPKHCDSHYAELKIPNGSLLQSEATTSSL